MTETQTILLEKQIMKEMKKRFLSLSELSRRIGKSRNYLSNMFSKHKTMSLEDFFRVCAVLNIYYEDWMKYYSDSFAPSNINVNPVDYMANKYNEFLKTPWYADFLVIKDNPKYVVSLDKECDECPIIDNAMKDDGIRRGSTVLYEKDGHFDQDGQIYCFALKDGQKQVRELYRCPDGYIVCIANGDSNNKAKCVTDNEITIYGKARYVINPLND